MQRSHMLERVGGSMPVKRVIIAIGLLFAILTGCASHAEVERGGEITRPEPRETEEPADRCGEEAGKNVVTLLVFGSWNDETDAKNEDDEYILEDEQAQTIAGLFYNHEMQINDSPTSSAASLAFQIGEDYLNTSMSSLETLSGRIDGELVTIELSEQEYEAVYQIASQYAQGAP